MILLRDFRGLPLCIANALVIATAERYGATLVASFDQRCMRSVPRAGFPPLDVFPR